MVRRLEILVMAILIAAMSVVVAGQNDYRSPFAIGMGARELGRGGAGVAGLSNANSIYWNPALLALVQRPEIQAFYMTLFMDTKYQFFSAAYPTLSAGGFGLGVGDLSSGKFERYDNYSKAGTFTSRQNLLLLGYGFTPVKRLALGASAKGVLFDIDQYTGTGFGFDFGALYMTSFIEGLSVGLKFSDIGGPRLRLHEIEQRFPWSARGGLAYSHKFSSGISVLANFDAENTEKSGTSIYTGGEFGISNIIFARVGYMADRVTMGAGLSYMNISFDYAYASLNDLGTNSHRLSLSYAFGASIEQRRAAREQGRMQSRLAEIDKQTKQQAQQKLDSLLTVARGYEQQNDSYKAIETYYQVLGIDNQQPEARQQVLSLFDQIKLDMSRQASNDYVTTLITKQIELGNTYFGQSQFDKAAEQYNFALVLDPQNQEAKDKLAQISDRSQQSAVRNRTVAREAIRNGNYRRALEAIDSILQVTPDDQQAIQSKTQVYRIVESNRHLDRAIGLYDQEKYKAASAQVDSALTLNPESEGAKSLKHRLTQYTAKETTLEDLKKDEANWKIYIQGMEKYQAGEYDKAAELWRSLLDAYPNNPNLKRSIEQAAERSTKR